MMDVTNQLPLSGWRVLFLESRREQECASLLRNQGALPIAARSMEEVPIEQHGQALAAAECLMNGAVDVLVLLTGVGTRLLANLLATHWPPEQVHEAFARTKLCARGPKPAKELRQLGLQPALVAPEPNTWRELVATMDGNLSLHGKRVLIQEYGVRNAALFAELERLGAQVSTVAIYAWKLPDDLRPLRSAVQLTVAGQIDAAMFTSAQQIRHWLQVADNLKQKRALLAALKRVPVASVGPITSETLATEGIQVAVEPQRPKMGHLVHALANWARDNPREHA